MDQRIKTIIENPLGTRPSWDEIRIHAVSGFASRASCHNVHSSTIITKNNQIIAEGYNGAPSQIENNCLQTGCRKKLKGLDYHSSLNSASCIGVHAEMNAAGHLKKLEEGDIVIYTGIFPCYNCAKNLHLYNPKKIIFKKLYSEKELKQTMDLFQESNIEVYQLDLSLKRYLDITFNNPSVMFDVWSDKEKEKMNKIIAKLE